MTSRLVVAAPASGSGKTTVACGLMAALRAAGHAVSGHKIGPDYIDPGYHALATGRPARNLDPFLCGQDRIVPLFRHGARGADLAVIEGVMGLFDGTDPGTGEGAGDPGFGSTAHVARLLGAPLVLVIDAASAGRSVAAVATGFGRFEAGTTVAGVILNRVASDRHERLLRDALSTAGMPVYGAIRRSDLVAVPSRHLGLIPAAERAAAALDLIDRLAALMAESCDLPGLVALARSAPPLAGPEWDPAEALATAADVSIGWDPAEALAAASASPVASARSAPGGSVAAPVPGGSVAASAPSVPDRSPVPGGAGAPGASAAALRTSAATNFLSVTSATGATSVRTVSGRPVVAIAGGSAFTFSYTEHGELLAEAGLDVAVFDPVRDERLPEGTAGIVLGGGFPEVHAAALSANESLRRDVAAAAARGGPVAAECAGLLYLARTLDGQPMCGVLPVEASMTGRLTLGYRQARAEADSVLASAGEVVRAHEFHRTVASPGHGEPAAWRLTAAGTDGDPAGRREGHATGNVHASYLHAHWAGYPRSAARFAAACRAAVARRDAVAADGAPATGGPATGGPATGGPADRAAAGSQP